MAYGSEKCPDRTTEADKYTKFVGRRDRALAIIVLFVDPAVLYLIGDPEEPTTVWKKNWQTSSRKRHGQTS